MIRLGPYNEIELGSLVPFLDGDNFVSRPTGTWTIHEGAAMPADNGSEDEALRSFHELLTRSHPVFEGVLKQLGVE